MPGSSPHGKAWIIEHLIGERPKRVLDIGAGCGTYAQLFRARWPGSHWTAVEVWEPYVDAYKLREQYDVVIVADARTWEPDEGRYSVVFLGDVLEHMTQKEARQLLDRMREIADIVAVSIPISYYPQGAWGGNPYEVHVVDDWTHEAVVAQLGVPSDFTVDHGFGVYLYHQEKARPLKVAVCAVALNESTHVERWATSAQEADVLVVGDNGSTDGTQQLLRNRGVTVHEIHTRPYRPDDVRNAVLALVPADVDYCLWLDMDEVLVDGWREHMEEAHRQGWTRPRFRYVFSWKADGVPDCVYKGDRIHTRFGYRWQYAEHSILKPYDGTVETQGWIGLEIHHHPTPGRPRPDYLPRLRMAVEEMPTDARMAHYYARELMYVGRWKDAAAEFRRYLALPGATWKPERAASMRYLARCVPAEDVDWLQRATRESPGQREPWVELAAAFRRRKEWLQCYVAATAALLITEKEIEYPEGSEAWGGTPYDEVAQAAHHLGRKEEAIRYGTLALELSPTDPRLIANMAFYEKGLGG